VKITVRDVGEVKVVEIEGSLDTQTSPEAQTQMTQLIDQGAKKIVVNFEKLDYVSSAGLRILLTTAKQLKGGGGVLRICGLNGDVQEAFTFAGFHMILTVKTTESEALEKF
jgi:anti-anti-sigma factor